jgi:hypothetical protein
MYDCNIPDTEAKYWVELTDAEKDAVTVLGWTESAWSCGELDINPSDFLDNGESCTIETEADCWSYFCDPETLQCADYVVEYDDGLLDNGDTCSQDGDCRSWYCNSAYQCDEFSLGEVGDACTAEYDCLTWYCDAVTSTCADLTFKDNGEACSADEECMSWYCNPGTGTCADFEYLPDGATCVEDWECDSYYCDQGNVCTAFEFDYMSMFGENGDSCDVDDDCWSLYCDPGSSVCADFVLGQAGDDCVVDWDCESYVCDYDTAQCVELKSVGETCAIDSECETWVCEQSQCAVMSFRPVGAGCAADYDCMSYYCDPSTSQCAELEFLDNGETCSIDEECWSYHCDQESFECSDYWASFTPSDYLENGETCTVEAEADCWSHFCDPDTLLCSDFKEIGDSCTVDYECWSYFCDSSECADPFAAIAEPCKQNEFVKENQCVPCPAGTTNPAGVADGLGDPSLSDTQCTATICQVNQQVIAHTCLPCPAGYAAPPGGDASSPRNTECSLIPTTGMCAGNTDPAHDVDCGADYLLLPNAEDLPGTTAGECCERRPAAPPEVTYVYEASVWSMCAFGCGARAPSTREVNCVAVTTYESGSVTRETVSRSACGDIEGDVPVASRPCDTLPAGTPCDDNDRESTSDQCTSRDDDAQCAGKVVMESKLVFATPTEDIALPGPGEDVDTSPAATAIKAGLVSGLGASLGEDVTITVLSISSGSMVVDYSIEVPAATATPEAKAAAEGSLAGSVEVALPLEGGGEQQMPAPAIQRFVTYAYVRTAGVRTGTCSTACGARAVVANDIYTCTENGLGVALSSCVPSLGQVPVTRTECCPDADPDTCVGQTSDDDENAPGPAGDSDSDSADAGDGDDGTPDDRIVLNRKTSAGVTVGAAASVVVATLFLVTV